MNDFSFIPWTDFELKLKSLICVFSHFNLNSKLLKISIAVIYFVQHRTTLSVTNTHAYLSKSVDYIQKSFIKLARDKKIQKLQKCLKMVAIVDAKASFTRPICVAWCRSPAHSKFHDLAGIGDKLKLAGQSQWPVL
jgi:hypothetical protein